MKTCNSCKKTKPLSDFWKKKSCKDGLNPRCGDCLRAYHRSHYKGSPKRKNQIRTNSKKWEDVQKQALEAFMEGKSCTDCGNDDRRVFEFDHISDDKEFSISDGMKKRKLSFKTILTEIAKCEIVCANCHRIRTVERRKATAGSSVVRTSS